MAVARRYGARETSSRRNLVLAHSMGCSLALRLAAEWGTNGVSVAALALLGATDVVPAVAASPIFRLPLCLLDRLQPLLSAGGGGAGLGSKRLSSRSFLACMPCTT